MSWDGVKIVTEDIKGVLVREGAERASRHSGAVVEGDAEAGLGDRPTSEIR
jgi:hypothetical protein